jgi:hypothetical protein
MYFHRVTFVPDLASPWLHLLSSWRAQLADWFHSYRPEKHYMRGPGPKCQEKQSRSG